MIKFRTWLSNTTKSTGMPKIKNLMTLENKLNELSRSSFLKLINRLINIIKKTMPKMKVTVEDLKKKSFKGLMTVFLNMDSVTPEDKSD